AFGYETVVILAAAPESSLGVPAIQARREAMGNSVLVGGDGRMVKVHVHNERPDEVIAYGLSLGTLTRISVENLDTMADDVREARAAEFVEQGAAAAGAKVASPATGVALAARMATATKTTQLPPARAVEPDGNGA